MVIYLTIDPAIQYLSFVVEQISCITYYVHLAGVCKLGIFGGGLMPGEFTKCVPNLQVRHNCFTIT